MRSLAPPNVAATYTNIEEGASSAEVDDRGEDCSTDGTPRSFEPRHRRLSWVAFAVLVLAAFAVAAVAQRRGFLRLQLAGFYMDAEEETSGVAVGLPAAQGAIDQFDDLGAGACLNQTGGPAASLSAPGAWKAATVLADGSSPECEALCREEPNCSGYVARVRPMGCALVMDPTFRPATGDGKNGSRCFWRHRFASNTSGIYDMPQPQIPKRIWSYWQPMKTARANNSLVLPVFLHLCWASWRVLNPGYEVHILNDTTIWDWLDRSDLPEAYDSLIIQHRSDALRMALLVKYGGFWIDASTLTLQPLTRIVGSDPSIRVFYDNGWATLDATRERLDKRVGRNLHVENWFIAAPRADPLLVRTYECLKRVDQERDNRTLAATGVFSQRHLDEFLALGINPYLSMHACIFQTIDDDAALTKWWRSDRVRILDCMEYVAKAPWVHTDLKKSLFGEVNEAMRDGILEHIPLVKLTRDMRSYFLNGMTVHQMLCTRSTFTEMLAAIGLTQDLRCIPTGHGLKEDIRFQ